MEMNAANAAELVAAIHAANATPNERYVIHLTGIDSDYVVDHAEGELFGGTAFPVVIGDVTVYGNGRTITRLHDAPPFRFFAVNSRSGHPGAKLTLSHLNLISGNSDSSGGGAIVNDGELILDNCLLQNNHGTLGGAIYCGDGQLTTILNCLFTQNLGTEQGSALYAATTSRLLVKSSLFHQNYVSDNIPSVFIAGVTDVTFEGCGIWDGIRIPLLGHANLRLEQSTAPSNDAALRLAYQPMYLSARADQLTQQAINRLPAYKPTPPWWTEYVAPVEVETVLKTLETQGQSAARRLIENLIFKGQLETLRELAVATDVKVQVLEAQISQLKNLSGSIRQQLAFASGVDTLKLWFELLATQPIDEFWRRSAMIAAGQPVKTIIQFFDENAASIIGNYSPKPGFDGTLQQIDILSVLVQELVVRGVNCETIPSITNFLTQKREMGYSLSHELLWLPLKLLDIEAQIPPALPTYYPSGGGSYPIPQLYLSTDNKTKLVADFQPPAFHETRPGNDHQRIQTAVQAWTDRPEVRVFEFDLPISDADVSVDLLVSLQLDCLQNATTIELRPAKPDEIISILFTIECNGGAYGQGMYAAYGRLHAWKSMAGFVGAGEGETIEAVEKLAQQTQWFTFNADGEWFFNVAWDIGIVALRPDRQTLVVLAASDTD